MIAVSRTDKSSKFRYDMIGYGVPGIVIHLKLSGICLFWKNIMYDDQIFNKIYTRCFHFVKEFLENVNLVSSLRFL